MKPALLATLLLACNLAYADSTADALKRHEAQTLLCQQTTLANTAKRQQCVARANSDAMQDAIATGAQIYGVPATKDAVQAARRAQKSKPTLALMGYADDAPLTGTDAKTVAYNAAAVAAQEAFHNACPTLDAVCMAAARSAWQGALNLAGHRCWSVAIELVAAERDAAMAAGTGCRQP